MFVYIIEKLLYIAAIIVFVIIMLRVSLFFMSGDIALILAGERIDTQTLKLIKKEYHLDEPLHIQIFHSVIDTFKGDWKHSYFTGDSVFALIKKKITFTAVLAVFSIFITIIVSFVLGILSAYYEGTAIDKAILLFSNIFVSTPVFISGIVFMYIIALQLHLLPPSGADGYNIKYLILPALTLGSREIATLIRIIREEIIAQKNKPYVISAYAKGIKTIIIYAKHILPNILIPTITFLGLELASYINGAVITETIFSLPGFGKLVYDSLLRRDIPVLQGCIIAGVIAYIVINSIIDIIINRLTTRQ